MTAFELQCPLDDLSIAAETPILKEPHREPEGSRKPAGRIKAGVAVLVRLCRDWVSLGWNRMGGTRQIVGSRVPEARNISARLLRGMLHRDETQIASVDALDEVSRETGKTIPQIALNWLLQRPTVASVIIGARNEEQLRQNLAAAGWNLTPKQVAKLDAASEVTPAYPYWHQRQFARNPKPV